MTAADHPPRCDGCAHLDSLPSVHPMRCSALGRSYPVGLMRARDGRCGPNARLWEPRDKYRSERDADA